MAAVDLWGPMKVSAIGGYNWVLGTACFSSAYLMASLLRTKDESYVHLETFLCKVRSLGFSVKILRIDNDSVLLGNNFRTVCLKWGITVQRTAPYSHWQLARIERQWRTLGEMAKCMVSYAQLPVPFWGYAFLAAVRIRNRVWSQG